MVDTFQTDPARRERLFLWAPVAFGCGIGAYFALRAEPPLWSGLLIAGVAAGFAVAASRRGVVGNGGVFTLFLFTALFGLGVTAAQWRTQAVSAPVLEKRIGAASVSGRVAVVETYTDGLRLTLERVRISAVAAHRTPQRVRVRLRGQQPDILPGDWVRLRASLSPPSAPAIPSGFDFQRQAFFQGVGAVGFAFGRARITAPAGDDGVFSLANWIGRQRVDLGRRVMAALPGTAGAMAAALITGERRAIPQGVIDAMRDSGLAHLLAISGLHIGLVAGLLFGAVRLAGALVPALVLCYPVKKWAAATAIAGALAYALIAGATLPTQRAFLMVGIALLGVILDRRGISLRAVAWAALVVLALQPESLLSASFQMSFAAVTALVAVYETYLARRVFGRDGTWVGEWRWSRRLALYAAGVLLTTLIAGAATAPFAIYHFNRVADYSLVANLFAVPLTALWIMPWAVVSMIALPFELEAFALMLMGWGIDLLVTIAETVAGLSGAVTLVPAMPTAGLALLTLGALWLVIRRGPARFAGFAGIGAGIATLLMVTPPDVLVDGEGRLMAVNVPGKGLLLSDTRAARFERDIWLRHLAGSTRPKGWPEADAVSDAGLACDATGCLYRAGEKRIALVRHERALLEDCWAADAVVAVVPVRRRCPARLVVDRFDLWREGAHAIWIEGTGLRVETVNGRRGFRPWVLRPKPRPKAASDNPS